VFDVRLNTKIALKVLGILDCNSNLMAVCERQIFLLLFKEYSYCNAALSKGRNHRVSHGQGGDTPYTLLKCLLAEALNKMENIIFKKEQPHFLRKSDDTSAGIFAVHLPMLIPVFLHARL
jgi:hypothetical protein